MRSGRCRRRGRACPRIASRSRAGHVGNAVGDAIAVLALAGGGDAAGARGIRAAPRAAGIDHRARLDRLAALEADLERLLVAALGPDLVEILAADRRDARVVADVRANRRMRRQAASRIDRSARGRSADDPRPATASRSIRAESSRAPIDHVSPRRERPHVAPFPNRGAGFAPRLEDDERLLVAHEDARRQRARLAPRR